MQVVWNPNKAAVNLEKHGVSFSDAEAVFDDPHALVREDTSIAGEQRHIALGLDSLGRVIVAVYTYQGENIRLISARKATPNESQTYARRIRF